MKYLLPFTALVLLLLVACSSTTTNRSLPETTAVTDITVFKAPT